jgi:ubiquinone/menaquinone biosynthesis C-methylase UbiE
MATILRDWSYQFPWFYNRVSWLAALNVGGEQRFRRLFLKGLNLTSKMQVLDMCCGTGQATEVLVEYCQNVTGLDASPKSLSFAKKNVPKANFVQAFAEKMPFSDRQFDFILTNTALHEMEPEQLRQILSEVHRVLKVGGRFSLVDFHSPVNPLLWLPVSLFLYLFETETAWQLIKTDLTALLTEFGFVVEETQLYAGGSLQVVRCLKQ